MYGLLIDPCVRFRNFLYNHYHYNQDSVPTYRELYTLQKVAIIKEFIGNRDLESILDSALASNRFNAIAINKVLEHRVYISYYLSKNTQHSQGSAVGVDYPTVFEDNEISRFELSVDNRKCFYNPVLRLRKKIYWESIDWPFIWDLAWFWVVNTSPQQYVLPPTSIPHWLVQSLNSSVTA